MDNKFNRPTAIYLAMFPGLGHLYLRKYRYAIPYLIGYLILVSFFTAILPVAPKANSFTGIYLVITIVFIYFFMASVSGIDVEYQCNLMGLQYYSPSCEFRIKNYGRAFHIWTTLWPCLGIIYSIPIVIFVWPSWIPLGIMIGWCIVAIIGNILIAKYRNVKYSDMTPCPGRDK